MADLTMQTAQERIDHLTKKADRLRVELESVERDIGAVKRTIEIFSPPPPPKRVRTQEYLNVNADELRGKRLEEALIYIAERNNGVINSRAARYLLIDAGVLRGQPATTSHALSTELRESERFERITRGKYKLVLQVLDTDVELKNDGNLVANEEDADGENLSDADIYAAIDSEEDDDTDAIAGF